MESDIKIITTLDSMENFFDYNDVCSVRYYKGIGKELFEARIRHADRKNYLKGTYTIPQIIAEFETEDE